MLTVHEDSLEYIPLSTREARIQKYDAIRRILDYYNHTNSLRTSDYQSFTVDASYALGLIKMALAKQNAN
jgi:hypothetical protein